MFSHSCPTLYFTAAVCLVFSLPSAAMHEGLKDYLFQGIDAFWKSCVCLVCWETLLRAAWGFCREEREAVSVHVSLPKAGYIKVGLSNYLKQDGL